MKMEPKIFFVAGNEATHLTSIFLENLLFYKKLKQETPLFIDTNKGILFTSKSKQKARKKELRMYDYYPELDITTIPFERIMNLVGDGKHENFFKTESHFTNIFIYDDIDPDTINLAALCDYLLFVVKNDTYSSGYLYKTLKQLKEKNMYKKILVIVSDTEFIEESAAVFVRLKAEIEEMLHDTIDAVFLGFLKLETKRLYYSLQKGQPYIKTFPDSGFCGLIKYINDKIETLPGYLHDQSFYKALEKTQHY
jgi:hypothetical protein